MVDPLQPEATPSAPTIAAPPPELRDVIELAKEGYFEEAEAAARDYLLAYPYDLQAWQLMAHISDRLNNREQLDHCYRMILHLEPENATAQRGLDRLNAKPNHVPAIIGGLLMLLLLAGAGGLLTQIEPPEQPAAQFIVVTNTPTATPIPPTPTGTPEPSPTPIPYRTPSPVDYDDLQADLLDLYTDTAERGGYDLGIAFVDVETRQVVSVEGDVRYHSMSSFKGPLIAYYYWLLERGEIEPQPVDEDYIARMLRISDNEATSCLFERVGGIERFNDWLAEEIGMPRAANFVLKWQDWSCFEEGDLYTPEIDWRYSRGDNLLDLPANELLKCGLADLPCDKAFAPEELALFYADLYQGRILEPANAAIMFSFMRYDGSGSTFWNHLPDEAEEELNIYTKGGSQQATDEYRVNFFVEAGVVETPQGAFALVVMMQRNPTYPGTAPISEAARLSYLAYRATH